MSRAVMQQALEVLKNLQGGCTDSGDGTVEAITVWCPEVIEALQAALAEPEQEPVACIGTNGELMWLNKPKGVYSKPIPLYIASTPRKPLTDAEIWNTYKNLWMFHPAEEPRLAGDVLKFARAVIAAYEAKQGEQT